MYSTTASTAATLQLAQAGVTAAQVGTTGATVGNYSTTLSGLSASTIYYYRAYVTNSTGTGYGAVESFTTSAAPTATITTGAITPATITAGSDVTVDYATTGTFAGGNVFTAELSNVSGSFASGTTVLTTTAFTATSLTVTIPGATAAGSLYKIRVNASSPATTGSASTNALTVTTPPAVPVLSTTAAGAITSASASSGGSITASSGSTVSARGVVYGLSANPRLGGSLPFTTDGTGTGTFTSALSGLTPGTTYFVAAYATNGSGTGYGADITFTTLAAPTIGATTAAPTSVYGGGSVTLTYSTTGTFGSGNVFTAELSDASGNFPGTALTTTGSTATTLTVTIPVGTAAGAAYVLRVVASNPATTGPASNAITVNAGLFEPFEQASKTGYAIASAALQTGSWTFDNSLLGTVALGDTYVRNTKAARLRNAASSSFYMNFDKANGAGTISVYAGTFPTDTNGGFALDVSIDGGTTWTAYSDTRANLPNTSLALYTFTVNITGPVRVRFRSTTAAARVDLDDLTITDFISPGPRLTATPNSLSLSATTGQVASGSYTLLGQSLPTGTTVSLSSSDASVEISVDGGTSYATTATSAATPASGNLVQTVLVRFTAPATAGTTNATIANDIASLGLSAPVAVMATAVPVVTYTWTGATSTSWIDPSNWTPARSTPSTTDVLVFDGSSTPAPTIDLDYPTTQTIGQLQFSNGVNATFTNTGNRTLSLSHLSSGADFLLPAGTTLTVFNPSASTTAAGLTIQLATGGKATIGGTLVFDAATLGTFGTGAHRLQGTTTNGIEFVSGSIFRAGVNFSGSAFGTTTANSVLFRNGSRYEQLGGGNPFALSQPASAVTFEAASLYYVGPGITIPLSMSGRTYGSLEYNLGTGVANATAGASAVTIAGNLTITSGNVSINNTSGVNLKGNLLVNGSSTLAFTPGSTATLQLNGTTTQTIGGSAPAGALTFESFVILQMNNPAGVLLARVLTLNKLTLTSGLLGTDATNLLMLANPASIVGGSSTSFVNGPLARQTPAGIAAPTPFGFPIGKGAYYRPLTLTAFTQSAASTYTAEQTEGNPSRTLAAGNGLGTLPLARVSTKRFYTVTSTNVTPGNFTGTITLSFGSDDYVNVPNDPDLVIAKRDATGANRQRLDEPSASFAETGGSGSGVGGALRSSGDAHLRLRSPASLILCSGRHHDLCRNVTIASGLSPIRCPWSWRPSVPSRQVDKAVSRKVDYRQRAQQRPLRSAAQPRWPRVR